MVGITKTTRIIVFDFELDEETKNQDIKLNGVLALENEATEEIVFISIGDQQIGFMTKGQLVDFARVILTEWDDTYNPNASDGNSSIMEGKKQ